MPDQPTTPPGDPPLGPGEPRSFGNGRYLVRRRLGAGNFATVYLADDERLAVQVAVKLLADRWSWEPEVRGRFVQEARLLRSFNDPRVIQIRDIAETDDGRPYIVMDYASRGTLEARLGELAQRRLRPDAAQLRVVARELAEALAVLHGRRVAHRDIKPSNLLISGPDDADPYETGVLRSGERLMLGDLGLAKDLAFDSGVTVGVGTAGYMAPEQTLPGAKIDTRTDIYAASALLAQIASGEPPDPVRRCSNGALLHGRGFPPVVPPALAGVLMRGLDVDPDLRPQTIAEWAAGVDAALASLGSQQLAAVPVTLAPPVSNPPVSNPPVSGPPPMLPTPVSNPPVSGPPLVLPTPVSSPGVGMPPSGPPSHPRPGQGIDRRVLIGGGAALALIVAIVLVVVLRSGDDVTGTTPSTLPAASTTVATANNGVRLDGPLVVTRGVEARWTVDAPTAVSGVWTLTGPVQPSKDAAIWHQGDYFRGTWNVTGTFTLTLTAADAAGNVLKGSVTFVVTAG